MNNSYRSAVPTSTALSCCVTCDGSGGSDCCVAQNEVQLARCDSLLLLSLRNLVSQKYPQRAGALGALGGSRLVQEDDQMCLVPCEYGMY